MKRVLIVEDDVELRRLFRLELTFSGYVVSEAGDGLEALRALDNNHVDLVVLDLGLPIVTGHAVLQEVAAQAHLRKVPVVIVVTGEPGPHYLPHAYAVLTKPVTAERLVAAVYRSLGAAAPTEGV